MKPLPWKTWIVAPLLGLVSFGLLRSLVDPSMGKPTPFTFPEQVPVAGWQLINHAPILESLKLRSNVLANQRYYYRRQSDPPIVLRVEMRYFLQRKLPVDTAYLANLFLIDNEMGTPLPFKISDRAFQADNYYSLFSYQQRAYLSACMDGTQRSTVSLAQFWQQRLDHDLRSQAIFSWLFGRASLIDQRCLWSQLSVSLQGLDTQTADAILDHFWQSWFRWWRDHYPQG
jgi:cyanosortase A-associated protein